MSVASLVREIEGAIRAEAGGRRPSAGTVFNKPGDEYVAYGIKAPELYGILRGFRAAIKALALEEQLDLAARLLARRIGEVGHAGIFVLRVSEKELAPKHLRALERMADDFIGWSHVDDFCDAVLQPLLVHHPAPVLRMLERWTRSRNRWKRRASVIAFTRKVGESGVYLDQLLAWSERLAFDPEDLVRKGVGWALKDSMSADKRRVVAFVKDLRRRGAPSVVTLYAIEKLAPAERADVLAVKRGS